MALAQLQATQLFGPIPQQITASGSDTTVNAAGESVAVLGYLRLAGGGTGAKTLSAAGGGSMFYMTGTTVTFADAGTNVRIGVQDLSGFVNDDTFDVYGDLVGGTDTIVQQVINEIAMGTGTKSMTPGNLYALVLEATSRGGSDSIQMRTMVNGLSIAQSQAIPWGANDTGSGPTAVSNSYLFAIRFDDGTLGWIDGTAPLINYRGAISTTNFSSASNPDEFGMSFRVPFRCRMCGVVMHSSTFTTTDVFNAVLYSDPFGTPVSMTSETVIAASVSANANGLMRIRFASPQTLEPNTDYVATMLAATGTVGFGYNDLGTTSANVALLKDSFNIDDVLMVGRQNVTGAFSTVQTYYVPAMAIIVDQLDDGAGGSGGFVGIIGG